MDQGLVGNGIIEPEKVRQKEITALVDSGSAMMAINETIYKQLGLRVRSQKKAKLADGTILELNVAGPIEVVWGNRATICNAMVLPGDSEPLLGSIPMQDLDLVVYNLEERIGLAPDQPENKSKKSLKTNVISQWILNARLFFSVSKNAPLIKFDRQSISYSVNSEFCSLRGHI